MRILTGLLVLTLSMGAMAQLAPGHYQAGRHYEVLEKPVATSAAAAPAARPAPTNAKEK